MLFCVFRFYMKRLQTFYVYVHVCFGLILDLIKVVGSFKVHGERSGRVGTPGGSPLVVGPEPGGT